MPKFRKKPVVIEAYQIIPNGHCGQLPPMWLVDAITSGKVLVGLAGWDIHTLEGCMSADVGDWVIQGVKGEIYPCKPDIFDITYDYEPHGV